MNHVTLKKRSDIMFISIEDGEEIVMAFSLKMCLNPMREQLSRRSSSQDIILRTNLKDM